MASSPPQIQLIVSLGEIDLPYGIPRGLRGKPRHMTATTVLPDAVATNWVDRHAPERLRPWLKLGRFDRPAGIWLLMLPGWQGIALAAAEQGRWPNPLLLLAVFIGAALMRAAGCAFNDIVDRDFDAQVARTAMRPIRSDRSAGMTETAGATRGRGCFSCRLTKLKSMKIAVIGYSIRPGKSPGDGPLGRMKARLSRLENCGFRPYMPAE